MQEISKSDQSEDQSEEINMSNKEQARKIFYKGLEGEVGLPRKDMQVRCEIAVAMMGKVICRIEQVYGLDAVDYFKIISHNHKGNSMIWDFLLDMWGDLIEKTFKTSGIQYTSRRSAKDIAAKTIDIKGTHS